MSQEYNPFKEKTYKNILSTVKENLRETPIKSTQKREFIKTFKTRTFNEIHNLWPLRVIENFIRIYKVDLTEIMEPWQILEYKTAKTLIELRQIIRHQHNHNHLNNTLRSSDFLIFRTDGSIRYVIECKYIELRDKNITNPLSFIISILNRYEPDIIYVVNDEFYRFFNEYYPRCFPHVRICNLQSIPLLFNGFNSKPRSTLDAASVPRGLDREVSCRIINEFNLNDRSTIDEVEIKSLEQFDIGSVRKGIISIFKAEAGLQVFQCSSVEGTIRNALKNLIIGKGFSA